MEGRRLLRDVGGPERFEYLRGLGADPDDLGRLDVATGTIAEGGLFVEAGSGDVRLLQAGDAVPEGVWIAQRDLGDVLPDGLRDDRAQERHGFGEGWGTQGVQLGENPPEPPGEGEVLTDAYLPGATGDPNQDPASEQDLDPRLPDPDAADAGRLQEPVGRIREDER